uniref:Coat protein n=1 Tax=Haemonchus contortus TaxID=6289 RepID=A0A7I4XW41_HAECO
MRASISERLTTDRIYTVTKLIEVCIAIVQDAIMNNIHRFEEGFRFFKTGAVTEALGNQVFLPFIQGPVGHRKLTRGKSASNREEMIVSFNENLAIGRCRDDLKRRERCRKMGNARLTAYE